jgi:hypothetical protein
MNAGTYAGCDVEILGRTECFVMAVFSNNKPTGIIYADRGIRHQPLTDDDFHSFKYFGQQANIGLSIYRIQKAP